MSSQTAENSLPQEFEDILLHGNMEELSALLDDQNISDVAELIYEYPEEEVRILSALSIHRAASTFKILDQADQERIIKNCPLQKPQNC